MIDKILQIAARETGMNCFGPQRLAHVFDSLEWIEFIMVLREEIGPLPAETAAKCDTFEDLAKAYAHV